MYRILYKPTFLRQYKKLPEELQQDVKDTIKKLAQNPKNPSLKSHKLKGALSDFWSARVDYSYRLIFEYGQDLTITCISVGDHDIYR